MIETCLHEDYCRARSLPPACRRIALLENPCAQVLHDKVCAIKRVQEKVDALKKYLSEEEATSARVQQVRRTPAVVRAGVVRRQLSRPHAAYRDL
eukprot:6195093-Pleurochrysis_carterae.AAC.1